MLPDTRVPCVVVVLNFVFSELLSQDSAFLCTPVLCACVIMAMNGSFLAAEKISMVSALCVRCPCVLTAAAVRPPPFLLPGGNDGLGSRLGPQPQAGRRLYRGFL